MEVRIPSVFIYTLRHGVIRGLGKDADALMVAKENYL